VQAGQHGIARKRLQCLRNGTGRIHRGLGRVAIPRRRPAICVVEFVGLCEPNAKRAEVVRQIIGVDCPVFTDFDTMVKTARPDLVAITTVDAHHAEYIVRALDLGIDVITEKPMVTDEAQCQRVLDAEVRNKRKIIVGFNYRFAPKHVKIKEVLLSGAIGTVTGVDFHWYLDTSHGADYFRRWHRLRQNGSLWTHKATHHFDLINWWLAADPVEVQAYGELSHYGSKGPFHNTNCRPCPNKGECPFYWDITKQRGMTLYTEAESVDGYLRDGCVFKHDIDIWDTMSATIRYSNNVLMSYSLNTFMPIEGYHLAFNGTKGRLEVRDYERQPWEVAEDSDIELIHNFGKREKVEIPKADGAHGGGDTRLQDLIFRKIDAPAHLRLPDSRAGAMSCPFAFAHSGRACTKWKRSTGSMSLSSTTSRIARGSTTCSTCRRSKRVSNRSRLH
jgi:predicted dehydrogenase